MSIDVVLIAKGDSEMIAIFYDLCLVEEGYRSIGL
jgi:hypothetical protein